jgi:hypothetical protein
MTDALLTFLLIVCSVIFGEILLVLVQKYENKRLIKRLTKFNRMGGSE